MRHDQRRGQDEYDEHRDPPTLAITALELTDVGDEVLNGMSCGPEESRSSFQMLPGFMIFPSEFFRRARHRISGPFRRLVPILARYHTRLRAALLVMGVWWVIVMAWGVWMPLPVGVSTSGPERGVARLEL